MTSFDQYQNPLVERYCSKEMSYVFSHDFKFRTWRKLWIELARAEQGLGLPISDAQIAELESFRDQINYEVAQARERETRHDVMSHVHAFGVQAPSAKGIIHLGATSAFVGDNTDLIQMREALRLIEKRIFDVIGALRRFAKQYRDVPTLGFTHFQPAQLTTVGKRACLWIQDLMLDLVDVRHRLDTLQFRGVKGTTGTQASFLELFDGDHDKVKTLDRRIASAFGFAENTYQTGQTYPRKVDASMCGVLSGVAQSASKFAHDLRLLAHLKEIEEPFEQHQIGSSAMPYKRNPMRTERMCALTRFVITSAQSPAFTAATQWFERTLDDSANKRLAIPECFMALDAVLLLYHNVASGLVVFPRMIERRIHAELPFMMSENILMEAVKRGGDRQELHEAIRTHAMAASYRVKVEGGDNDLLDRIAADSQFNLDRGSLTALMDPRRYMGRAPEQVDDYLSSEVDPHLEAVSLDEAPQLHV
ncbi:MAG: adenylosuccinate lyase [Acidobacteria bacterium]|nr:adenylosuccinate lyase [Acidobacteriota bacterium]